MSQQPSVLARYRRREWTVPVEDGPLKGEASHITIRALSVKAVDRCEAASLTSTQEAYGDAYESFVDRAIKSTERRAGKPDAPKPKTDIARVRSRGLYPPAVVAAGVVAVGSERLPDRGSPDLDALIDDLPVDVVGWLALQVCIGRGANGECNGLLADEDAADRPPD